MNELELFDFRGNQVRVVLDEHGEPRWVAADVAKVLGYRDAANMTRMLDREDLASEKVDVGTHEVSTSQVRRVTVVNESGLYTAIFHSRRPEATAFRRWVTDEVLPAIRRHGGYLTPAAAEQALTDPDFIIRLATSLKEERARAELEVARANRAEHKAGVLGQWKRATEAGDGLKLSDFRAKYFTGVPYLKFFEHLYTHRWLRDERGHRHDANGNPKDGPNHMAPLRKGNGILYRHEEGRYGGKKRLRTRVIAKSEITFRDALIAEGLAPNEHSTGLVLISAEELESLT